MLFRSVYYGEKPWDGATTLHGMLSISKEMERYVNDYKILLVEARNNDLNLHNINNIDLFNLLGILLNREISSSEAKSRVIAYVKEHRALLAMQ